MPLFAFDNKVDIVKPKWDGLERKDNMSITMEKQIPVTNIFGDTYYQTLKVQILPNSQIWCEFGNTHFTIDVPKAKEQWATTDNNKVSLKSGDVWYDIDNTKDNKKVIFEFRGMKTDGKFDVKLIPDAGKTVWVDDKTMWVGTKDKVSGKPLEAIGFNWSDAIQPAIPDIATQTITFIVDSANPFLIDPSVVVSPTNTRIGENVGNRHTFYANGRHWVFYWSSDTEISVKTSTDGTSWSGATSIRAGLSGTGENPHFDIYFDGTYLHYAITENKGALPNNAGLVYYRRGTPDAAGTITWSAAEQTAYTNPYASGYPVYTPSIAVDDSSHAYIAFSYVDNFWNGYCVVTRNTNTDGTWATTAGYPYQLLTGTNPITQITPQTSGKMYVIYGAANSAIVYGRAYDGTNWGAQTTVRSNKGSSPFEWYIGSIVNYGDLLEYVYGVTTTNDIKCMTYDAGWGAATTIALSQGALVAPTVTSLGNGDLVCCWINSNHVYYKKRIGGSWDASATDWINEADTILKAYYHSSSYLINSGVSSYIYLAKASSPYDLKYAFLATTLPSVTTNAASSVSCNTTTLNGNITATGGENNDWRGFVWDTVSRGDPGDTTPPATYSDNWTESGSFGTGSFSHGITGLAENTPYYVRAFSHNSAGWEYGGEITFETLGDPDIVSVAATSVTTSTARLQAYLTDDGNEACQVRFGWGTVDQGNNIDAYNGTGSPSAWGGAYTTGQSPYLDVSSLAASTTYYFNVEAFNTCGKDTGASRSFTTESSVGSPSNATFVASYNSITLSWVKGYGAPNTKIRFMENDCPTDNVTGAEIYGGTASTYEHTGLTSGTDYCYWFAGYDPALGYSTGNVTLHATTLAGDAGDDIFGTVPTAPTGWATDPDASALTDVNPLAPVVNAVADSIGMPRNWFWAFGFLLVLGGFAYGAYRISHEAFAPIIVIILGSAYGGLAHLMPYYIAAIMVILGIGFLIMKFRSRG